MPGASEAVTPSKLIPQPRIVMLVVAGVATCSIVASAVPVAISVTTPAAVWEAPAMYLRDISVQVDDEAADSDRRRRLGGGDDGGGRRPPADVVARRPMRLEHSTQPITVPPPAETVGKVIATSFVTEPDAAADMLVELIACRA